MFLKISVVEIWEESSLNIYYQFVEYPDSIHPSSIISIIDFSPTNSNNHLIMSNQEQESSTEIKTVSENTEVPSNDENIEKPSVSSEVKVANEQPATTTRRVIMPQDIRYSTEQGDREKLMEKYDNYQVSDSNSCIIRFLTDHRQKKNLLGRHEEENSNLDSIGKTFNVRIHVGYQNSIKHSFKVSGTEANVRKCLIETLNRMFKSSNRSSTQNDAENNNQSTSSTTVEETEVSTTDEKTPEPATIFVTTINPDSSITEEQKLVTPSTPNENEEKTEETTEEEQYKFVPMERKPEYTFILLITSQGQEVLKKNWNFFAGSLQQRLNVTVTNPIKLHKFGDKQWQNELSITSEFHENIIDAVLQITAFINDVLGIANQPYKADDDDTNDDSINSQRTKSLNNSNDYHQQRRHDYNNNNGYRPSPSHQQGHSSPFNNNHDRAFSNRNRNGLYEQIILIRGNCVARIVGTRGSNIRRIQSKCHLCDMNIARHPNENGYVECKLSAYQMRNLNFALDTIRSFLRNEDDQAVQVFDAYYVDLPSQPSAFQNDQPPFSTPHQNFDHFHQPYFPTNHQQPPPTSFTGSTEFVHPSGGTGFMTRPLHFNNGTPLPPPSYNFQNPPSFDFTHRPTSASRKTDKRPGEVNEFNNLPNNQTRTSNDNPSSQNGGSSSSNSSSVSPRHKSKRTCPETKEIDCTTDEGFWIQKQHYHALDDASKELFDSLLEKLEKIRIANDENAARKQQRLVGRNRPNKTRGSYSTTLPSSTQTNDENDSTSKQDSKVEESNKDDEKELPTSPPEATTTSEEK